MKQRFAEMKLCFVFFFSESVFLESSFSEMLLDRQLITCAIRQCNDCLSRFSLSVVMSVVEFEFFLILFVGNWFVIN